MSSPLPSVSIVIACYNQSRYLADAISGVLDQRFPQPIEVIIVDDGSTDGSGRIAAECGSPAVRVLRQPNRGQGAARNLGAAQSKGELLVFMDADDIPAQGFVEAMATAARDNPQTDVFCGSWHAIDEFGQLTGVFRQTVFNTVDPFHRLLRQNVAPLCCYCVRRSAFEQIGGFDEHRPIQGSEDWELWLHLAAQGAAFVIVEDALSYYRQHDSSASRNFDRMWQSGIMVLKRYRYAHGAGCARCAAGFRAGKRLLRAYSVLRGLAAPCEAAMANGGVREGWKQMRRHVQKDPMVLCTLANTLARRYAAGMLNARRPPDP